MQFIVQNVLLIAIAIVAALALFLPKINARRYGPEVDPEGAIALINQKNALPVDLRKPKEYRDGHIAGAVNYPFDSFAADLEKLPKDRTILLVDELGAFSRKAVRMLHAAGYADTAVLDGGLTAWGKEKLPLVR